uniref:iron-sulfur cluster carrier protein ApbC n=1 Tax=Thaumasiovibrio occultus TaxID=1891184 RepID=UPI000B352549|nr:iron-sulfur cluster carrier protein ApbC [Thaumasiovibrio occultus]
MAMVDKAQIQLWLNQYSHPLLPSDWADHCSRISASENGVHLVLPFACGELKDTLIAWAARDGVTLDVEIAVQPLQAATGQLLPKVKNIIAVSSGKGGVGKSATAANLAFALKQFGATVGLLDADIYGPSLPTMLGSHGQHPETLDGKLMQPVMCHGIATNSIGYLIDDADAAIWRGPMASKALQQLLKETAWPDLDYLVIDLPPGTGDIQLTLAQQIPVTSAVVVTTPQDLALADVRKGVAMFEKVGVPVSGIVENMSYHQCSQCGHEETIFGCGGAAKLAQEAGLTLLAQLPLHIQIREHLDAGLPTVMADPHGDIAQRYCQMAERIVVAMYWNIGKAALPIFMQPV